MYVIVEIGGYCVMVIAMVDFIYKLFLLKKRGVTIEIPLPLVYGVISTLHLYYFQ